MIRRIILGEARPLVRVALTELLRTLLPGVSVVEQFGSSDEVVSAAQREAQRSTLFLLSADLSPENGFVTSKRLTNRAPNRRVVIYAFCEPADGSPSALSAGARGYCPPSATVSDLVAAIISATDDPVDRPSTPGSAPAANWPDIPGMPRKEGGALTNRQRQVLRLIADGLTEREIGTELGISFHTVHVHKNNIMRKLGLHTKAHLVRFALQAGIIE